MSLYRTVMRDVTYKIIISEESNTIYIYALF